MVAACESGAPTAREPLISTSARRTLVAAHDRYACPNRDSPALRGRYLSSRYRACLCELLCPPRLDCRAVAPLRLGYLRGMLHARVVHATPTPVRVGRAACPAASGGYGADLRRDAGFLAAGFFAVGFFAAAFLTTAFFAAGFFAAGFFAAAFFAAIRCAADTSAIACLAASNFAFARLPAAVIDSPALARAAETSRSTRRAVRFAGTLASSILDLSLRAVRRSTNPASCAATSSAALAWRATRDTLAFASAPAGFAGGFRFVVFRVAGMTHSP